MVRTPPGVNLKMLQVSSSYHKQIARAVKGQTLGAPNSAKVLRSSVWSEFVDVAGRGKRRPKLSQTDCPRCQRPDQMELNQRQRCFALRSE